jgi:nitroreductase
MTDTTPHALIRRRRSPRAFDDREVDPSDLRALFEAARWAASAYNEQPWRYIVGTRGTPAHDRLLESLVPANRRWAQAAPVLALSVARTCFTRNDKANRHALHDTGAASAQLTLEATARGLAIHQMAGFDAARARGLFGIPEGFEPVAALAIGYPGTADTLPEDLRERETAPRSRRALGDTVFGARWEQAADVVS